MKGVYGLLIAVGLGVAAALVNWGYLARKARDVEREAFLGVAEGVTIRPGDVFKEEDLVAVEIPKNRVGSLPQFAVLYADRFTVIGGNAVRDFESGQLILRQDLKAPPPEPRPLGPDEREIGIPVDKRTFVPSLYKAGDWISFVVPKVRSVLQPTPENSEENAEENGETPEPVPSAATAGGSETIGPFEIRTIGNRVASSDVSRASRLPQVQENVLNIIVKVQGDELEPKARKLFDLLLNYKSQFVILGHPRPKRD
jgi:hypothetical protein